MASMRDIKRRKESVQSTQQITKAMKLVSTVKLQKARGRAESNKPYFNMLYDTICSILAMTKEPNHKFLKENGSDKKAVIAITSNRGLAGGYNNNVVKEIVAAGFSKEDTYIYGIGKKGTFFSDTIDIGILLRKSGCNNLLYNIVVVTTGKSTVRCDRDNCLLVTAVFLQEFMVWFFRHCKDGTYRIIEHIKIWFVALSSPACFLKLNCRDKLHRLGDLLRALDAFFAPLNVSHGCQERSTSSLYLLECFLEFRNCLLQSVL